MRLPIALAAALSACIASPDLSDSAFVCEAEGDCPAGFVCDRGTCVAQGAAPDSGGEGEGELPEGGEGEALGEGEGELLGEGEGEPVAEGEGEGGGAGEGEGEGEGAGEGEGEGEPPPAPLERSYRAEIVLATAGEREGTAGAVRLGDLVELPLVGGGYMDRAVVGYWPLEGTLDDAGPRRWAVGDASSAAPAPDLDGRGEGAMAWPADADPATLPGVVGATTLTGALTVCGWIRHGGDGDEPEQGETRSILAANGVFDLGAHDAGVRFEIIVGDVPVSLLVNRSIRAWTQLCGVWDGRRATLYVDGDPVHGAVAEGQLGFPGGDPVRLGGGGLEVDEVLLLTRALSAGEVRGWFRARRGWGRYLFPAAQQDGDDLRVVEGADSVVPHSLTGARPLGGRAEDLDPSVLHYFPLAGVCIEIVSDGRSLSAGTVHWQAGRFGDLRGAVDVREGVVRGAGPPDRNPVGAYTLEAWTHLPTPPEAPARRRVVTRADRNHADRGYGLWLEESGPACTVSVDGEVVLRVLSLAGGPTRRWAHWACTWDGEELDIWIDGVRRSERWEVEGPDGQARPRRPGEVAGDVHATEATFRIGFVPLEEAEASREGTFPGLVDEVALHTVARSADWLRRRADPLPRLQFRAATFGDADGAWRPYAVQWGRKRARPGEQRQASLLSPGSGWLSWLDLDDPALGHADRLDRTAARHHGVDRGDLPAFAAPHGAAIRTGEEAGRVEVLGRQPFRRVRGLTLEAVVQAEESDAGVIVSDGTGQLRLEWTDAGGVTCAMPGSAEPVTAPGLVAGRWYALACVLDSGSVHLYVDGRPVGTSQGGDPDNDLSEAPLTIGSTPAGGQAFAGWIDEVRLREVAADPTDLMTVSATIASSDSPWAPSCPDPAESGAAPLCNRCPPGVQVAPGLSCVGAPGVVTLGSPDNEPGSGLDEPERTVTLTRNLLADRTEVTQAAWLSLMGDNPSAFSELGDASQIAECALDPCPARPVESVSWYRALAYANARSDADDLPACYRNPLGASYADEDARSLSPATWPEGPACRGWRLPTDAEWEHLARGGRPTPLPGGFPEHLDCAPVDPIVRAVAWYCGNAGSRTHGASHKPSGPFDLHGTAGNVAEWVWDTHSADPAGDDIHDPTGPDAPADANPPPPRIVRGGAYDSPAADVRAAARAQADPRSAVRTVGLRLVRSL